MLPLIATSLLLVTTVKAGQPFTIQCFSSKADHAVSNAHPIAELFRVSVQECLNYCIVNAAKVGDGCMSVVYHREYSTCQLYGHDGNYAGAVVVPASGHDFFLRTNWVGACQDRVVPKRGYQQRPKIYGVSSKKKEAIPIQSPDFTLLRQEVTTTTEVSTTTTEERVTIDPRVNIQLPEEMRGEEEEEETFEDPVNPIAFLNPTHSNQCSPKEKVSYFVLFGYKLAVHQRASKLNGIDQSSCILYCSQNIDAHGTSIPCYSANYDPINEKCELYAEQKRKFRNLAVLSENKNYIFADKFCLKTKKDCSAEQPYVVYAGKQMHSKIVHSIPGMNSVVACLAACIDHRKCKAVTYKVGLCIMHGASPTNELLVNGNEGTMVVENGCQLTANAVPALISTNNNKNDIGNNANDGPEWEEWSACQFGIEGKRMRVRHRDCSDCEDLQVEEC